MAKYVSKTRLAKALRSLAAYNQQLDSMAGEQLLPLLALKRSGAATADEIQFEEQDDFRFWDRYCLVDSRSQTARYYDPLTASLCAAAHPHSHVATARKETFACAWRAGAYRVDGGRTFWTLATDYLRRVRERVLSSGGSLHLLPTWDLAAWLWRHESFPDSMTPGELQQELRRQFNLSAQEFGALFDPALEPAGTFFGTTPLTSDDVRELIDETVCGPAVGAAAGQAAAAFSADPAALAHGLALPDGIVEQAITALAGGGHLILAGPSGTGKSTLAELLALEATRSYYASGYRTATATAEWTTFETIGGNLPSGPGGEFEFYEGIVLRSIREDSWCIVDELNRANIDRAVGPLLTLLAGSEQTAVVELPQRQIVDGRIEPVRIRRDPGQPRSGKHRDSGDYVIGRNWRLLATMNTQDRGLFPLTGAFARRFATVHVGVPPAAGAFDVLGIRPKMAREVFGLLMGEADDGWLNPRPLGPAIVKDAWRYMQQRYDWLDAIGSNGTGLGNGTRDGFEAKALAEAVVLYALPQYGGLGAEAWRALRDRLAQAFANGAPPYEREAIVKSVSRQFDAAHATK